MALPLCVGRALRENSQSPSSIVAASNAAQACWRRRSVSLLVFRAQPDRVSTPPKSLVAEILRHHGDV